MITPPNSLHIINIHRGLSACFVGKGPADLGDGGVVEF